MKKLAAALIGLGVVALAAAAPMAQTTPLTEVRGPFDSLKLSAELARSGHQRHDPWALAVAARIRKLTPVQEISRTPEGVVAAEVARHDDVAAWLAEAEDFGGDDARILALVREVRAMSFKGRSGGPQLSKARLGPGAIHQYGEVFQIGHPAVVYVEGDGDTDLMLSVRAPGGNAACSEMGPGDVKLCAWTAVQGGRYAVEVRNPGRVDNAYALATN